MATTHSRVPRRSSRLPQKSSGKKSLVSPLTPAQLVKLVQVIAQPSGTTRYGGGKALIVTAEKFPARIYPHFDSIAALLDSDSRILRWTALLTLGPLAGVDTSRKIDAVLDRCVGFIHGDNLITAANAVKCLAQVARHRPDLLDRAVDAILDVESGNYETSECRNVAIGQALNAFEKIDAGVFGRPRVAAFVARQLKNPRAAVAKRAQRLLARGRA